LDDDRFVYSDLTRRTGAIVLSSSHGDEPAFEYDDFHNSVFTKVVLLALTSSVADANQDGFLSTTELRNWVAKEVPRQTGDRQHPTVDRDNSYVEIKFPLLQTPTARAVLTRPDPGDRPPISAGFFDSPARVGPARVLPSHACGCRFLSTPHDGGSLAAALAFLMAVLRRRSGSNHRSHGSTTVPKGC